MREPLGSHGSRCSADDITDVAGFALAAALLPQLVGAASRLNNAVPSVQLHYKAFRPTTNRSVPVYLDGLKPGVQAIVGSYNLARACELFKELLDHKLIRVKDERLAKEVNNFERCALTFEGWEKYEAERRGSASGNYGFIAMKFGDHALEAFAKDVVKPTVQSLGFDLIDMRDAAEAGIIDNILRVKIRDAAFVLVDLTHDNSGAYWEAGYAEGIGKPVLYLCEREKFEAMSTHFDTNHLTTVPWETSRADDFKERLVATLRNTLKLFD